MIREIKINTVIVGTGAAGYAAALRLHQKNEYDIAIVTENIKSGTSRNTGSDKQTYYKLSLAGEDLDSVLQMTEDLFAGQCVDGDMALCEAALSMRGFYNLAELGVPFPCTEYGEYMGYKTDHDRGRRATSAGPYTSKLMTECLEQEVERRKIHIYDQWQVIKILTHNQKVYGIVCLDKTKKNEETEIIVWCEHVIWATGGPAGIYHDSVYPVSQIGASGIAFEAGIRGKNLTEWQFGMASVNPRWNVSGTYMQVLPRFISMNSDGTDKKDFLMDYFETPEEMMSMIFLKGYQWPFDVNKIHNGSSVIDLLVYQETILKGRKVYLDFRSNYGNGDIHFEKLEKEAYEYLKNAGGLFGTPIERLEKMNYPAITFYMDHQVDLSQQPLEIAICAQHNNGGLATDAYWETNIKDFFAIGEVCGSHGVTRPGGTALNAGQVGAIRAAECISQRNYKAGEQWDGERKIREQLRKETENYLKKFSEACGTENYNILWERAAKRMSKFCGMIRNLDDMERAYQEVCIELSNYKEKIKRPDINQLPMYYRLYDMLLSQKMYMFAMIDYCRHGNGSRGSALYTDEHGINTDKKLPELFQCVLDDKRHADIIQEVYMCNDEMKSEWRKVRKIPQVDYFFENQWKKYRDREHIR